MSILTDKIVSISRSYIGQKEVPQNLSFVDKNFLAKMISVGWYKPASWCAFFAKLVWVESYTDPVKIKLIKKYSTGGTLETFDNYHASKEFTTNKTIPKIGAVVIWKHGNKEEGHAGIVVSISADGSKFNSVEGNTSYALGTVAEQRNGVIVAEKTHITHKPYSEDILNIYGFIYPLEA